MDVHLTSITNLPQDSYNFANSFGTNPMVLIILIVIILLYYILFAFLGHNDGSSDGSLINEDNKYIVFVEAILWGLFIILILLNGVTYFFNIDIMASVKKIFSKEPEILIKVDNIIDKNIKDVSGISGISGISGVSGVSMSPKEVFNISENDYTYDEAQALCKAYDSTLATYDQIYDAYKDGASWCNYGWSADQMAFFPTQKKVWEKLQEIENHEHDCGRIGINGGYIANPNVRFGVNCYGDKPLISAKESKLMYNRTLYPKSLDDYKIDKQAQIYKTQLDNILISPFNNTSWSKL